MVKKIAKIDFVIVEFFASIPILLKDFELIASKLVYAARADYATNQKAKDYQYGDYLLVTSFHYPNPQNRFISVVVSF
ncbi:MAG TPA: hypothetical protein DCS93_34760 [Microscillaceae bacterium]|nr:hypothetical protein [Microscillaceae bacterium]